MSSIVPSNLAPPPSDHESLGPADRRTALLALLLLVPAPSLGVFFAMVFEPTRGAVGAQIFYGLMKLWIIALPALWMIVVDRQRPGVSPARHGGLGVGALLGLIIAAVVMTTYFLVGDSLIDATAMREAAVQNGIGTPIRYLALTIPLALFNALIEEYVWRWFVFRKCEALVGGRAAVVVSALFFTLHHVLALVAQTSLTVTALATLGVFIGGCAWSWCYLKYRSIWPGYVSHVIVDLAVFTVGWLILFN
jgi:membrane protease YdiL (CAAX protease family)